MRKMWILAALVVLLIVSPVIAETPTTELTVNGEPVNLEGNLAVTVQGSGNDVKQIYELTAPIKTADYEIVNVIINYKEDPSISYAIAIIDTGAPSSFAFTFNSAMNPVIAGPNLVRSSMSLSTTDGGTDGVVITSLAPPAGVPVDSDGVTELQVTTVSDASVRNNIGLDLGGPGITLPNPPESSTWGPFSEGVIPGPVSATGWDNIQVNVNFQGSGGEDLITLNGRSTIELPPPVPEFPTMALPVALIIGMLGAVLFIQKTKEQ